MSSGGLALHLLFMYCGVIFRKNTFPAFAVFNVRISVLAKPIPSALTELIAL